MTGTCVVIVTGASSGIGAAAAKRFAQAGYRVVLAARRIERLQDLAGEIEKEGGQALPVAADLSRLEDIQNLARTALECYGQIDVLFNNAGFGRLDWLENLEPVKDVQAQLQINLISVIWMTQAVLPGMIKRQKGHIINMASAGGLVGSPTYSVYAAGKFGVRGFSEALRREVSVYGINVSAVYPGGVKTEFGEHAGIRRKTGVTTPKWMVLSAEDVANVVYRLVKHPKRMAIIPGLYRPMFWLNTLFPGFVDWTTREFFVRKERL